MKARNQPSQRNRLKSTRRRLSENLETTFIIFPRIFQRARSQKRREITNSDESFFEQQRNVGGLFIGFDFADFFFDGSFMPSLNVVNSSPRQDYCFRNGRNCLRFKQLN